MATQDQRRIAELRGQNRGLIDLQQRSQAGFDKRNRDRQARKDSPGGTLSGFLEENVRNPAHEFFSETLPGTVKAVPGVLGGFLDSVDEIVPGKKFVDDILGDTDREATSGGQFPTGFRDLVREGLEGLPESLGGAPRGELPDPEDKNTQTAVAEQVADEMVAREESATGESSPPGRRLELFKKVQEAFKGFSNKTDIIALGASLAGGGTIGEAFSAGAQSKDASDKLAFDQQIAQQRADAATTAAGAEAQRAEAANRAAGAKPAHRTEVQAVEGLIGGTLGNVSNDEGIIFDSFKNPFREAGNDPETAKVRDGELTKVSSVVANQLKKTGIDINNESISAAMQVLTSMTDGGIPITVPALHQPVGEGPLGSLEPGAKPATAEGWAFKFYNQWLQEGRGDRERLDAQIDAIERGSETQAGIPDIRDRMEVFGISL